MKNFNSLHHFRWFIAILITAFLVVSQAAQSQTITGTAFFDGNNNGAQDAPLEVGFPGVVVNAYGAANTVVATSTTSFTGTIGAYTLSGLTSGQTYRLEFIVPSGYNDGAMGATSPTSVQFVQAGATNANFGVYVPGKSLPDKNIRVIAGCAGNGFLNGIGVSTDVALASWNYNENFQTIQRYATTVHTDDALRTLVGTPFGLAAQKVKGAVRVIISTIASPNAGLTSVAPDGIDALYMADYSGPNNTYLGAKLLTKLSALTPSINTAVQNPVGSVTNIGEYGLGGITISEDNKTLYVVNMGNGKIVKVDISSADYATIPAGGYTNLPVSEITIPTGISACVAGVFRPSIVKYHAGSVYVAGVCDASASTPVRGNSNLRLKVLKMNPSDNTFTLVMDADLSSFQAGSLSSNAGQGPNPGHFQTIWKDAFITGAPDGEVQPLINDMAFDDTGSLLIGVANRGLFQASNNTLTEMGYMVRTWRMPDGTFALENAGVSGPYTSTARINPSTTAFPNSDNDIPCNFDNDNRGPGLKYFFEQAIIAGGLIANNGHPYLYNGGIFIVPGTARAVVGFTDQMAVQSSGTRYFDWRTGVTQTATALTPWKIFAVTGVEGVSEPAPIEIGNRVWKDTNNNGIQDPDEPALAGVTVTICAKGTTTPIATATTDANGNYIFSTATGTSTTSLLYGLALSYNTEYDVKVTALGSDPSVTGLTLTNIALAPGEASGVTNTGMTLANSDAFLVSGVPSATVKVGSSGQNNHSYDFGFKTVSCVTPTAISFTKTLPTCTGTTADNNGKITFTSISNSDKYFINAGTNSTGTYATASAVPASGIDIQTAIPNIGGYYTIRFYNGGETCFKDTTLSMPHIICTAPCPDPHVLISEYNFTDASQDAIMEFPFTNTPNPTACKTTPGVGGEAIVIDEVNGFAYIATRNALVKFDKATGTYTTLLSSQGGFPFDVSLSLDKSSVYMTINDTGTLPGVLLKVNATTGAVEASVPLSSFTPIGQEYLWGVDVHPTTGEVYTTMGYHFANPQLGKIYKFPANLSGSPILVATAPATGNFVGIDFASDGTFWTVLSVKNHPTGIEDKIYHYKADGTLLQSSGFAPLTTVNRPFDLAIGPDGNVYVTAFDNFCVAKFKVSDNQWSTYLGSVAGVGGKGIAFYCGAFTCTVTCVKPNAGTDQAPACVGSAAITTATLAATAVSGGAWTQVVGNPAGAVVTTPSSATSGVTGLTPGVYNFIWATSPTCSDTVKITIPNCTVTCPTIVQSADTTICAGSTITLRADLTNITTQDIKFVYFNTHQTDATIIYGTPDGVLGTVTNAQLTASKTKAALSVTIPATPASKTYHVYAILSPTPTDANCRPFGHRHVITDPTKCPCSGPDCLTVTVKKN